jgi:EAL domain-containing protein (putative c-di-GMP-specific phosphodiesterase class I)
MPVTEKLGIGAYIGVPINLSNGKLYVTFCCYKSHHDESLNDRDLSFLNIISEIATGLIEKNLSKSISRNHAKSAIKQIISDNDISIYFQPIFSLKNNKVAGFESLARFFTTPYKTPDVWFKEAKKVGLNETLEMLAIKNAVTNIAKFNNSTYIAINCSPSHILSGALENTLQNIDCTRLVLEITEHSPISDYEKMRTSLTPLRKRGLRLAIDDVGAGFSSFQHILELEADIVAEGIETEEELNSLRKLNVDSVQGYFIGRPAAINDALSLLNATLPA